MNYEITLEINLPRKQVIELFDNFENIYKRQPTLKSHKHISWKSWMPWAKTSLIYSWWKWEMEMIETILVRDLPNEFSWTYEAKWMFNIAKNFFEVKDENTTIRKTWNEFKCKWIMMTLMCRFLPGNFKRETLKMMKSFKNFAEKEGIK